MTATTFKLARAFRRWDYCIRSLVLEHAGRLLYGLIVERRALACWNRYVRAVQHGHSAPFRFQGDGFELQDGTIERLSRVLIQMMLRDALLRWSVLPGVDRATKQTQDSIVCSQVLRYWKRRLHKRPTRSYSDPMPGCGETMSGWQARGRDLTRHGQKVHGYELCSASDNEASQHNVTAGTRRRLR